MKQESEDSKKSAFFSLLSDMWHSRGIPLKFEREGDAVVITGWKDDLLPNAAIPAEIRGLPVRKIAARAFHECDFITEMRLADGIEIIGANAFSDCEKLSKVYMADSVHKIERNAFYDCRTLFCVEFSETLREIERRAFFGCTGLRDITLPDSLEIIGEQAFCGCAKLKSIRLPLALKEFARNAFEGCTALDNIYLEKDSPADRVLSVSSYYSQRLRYIPRI